MRVTVESGLIHGDNSVRINLEYKSVGLNEGKNTVVYQYKAGRLVAPLPKNPPYIQRGGF